MFANKNIVKKVLIPAVLLLIIIIALTVHACWSRGDSSSVGEKEKEEIQIDENLRHTIDSFVTKTPAIGKVGLMVYDATAQKEVYSLNEDSLMSPASCMKLLTSVATLKKLGRANVHKTRLYVSGKVEDGTLNGDVTLKTQFDPFFNCDSLYKLTEALNTMGIKKIEGKVVLDMAVYTRMDHEEHWTIGDLRTRYLGLPLSGGAKLRTEMIYALSRLGIKVKKDDIVYGRLRYSKSKQIGEIRTPLCRSINKALKNSSNINAEALLYPLGYTKNKNGNFRNNGCLSLRDFVEKELKMDADASCRIEDGCGLCPDDKLTARLLVNLLNYVYKKKNMFREVNNGLPTSGIDGTLYDRLYAPSVKGKIKAKTGTLTREGGVSSLAGYFYTEDGHLIIFAILNNQCPVMDGRWWQDKFLSRLCEIRKTKKGNPS